MMEYDQHIFGIYERLTIRADPQKLARPHPLETKSPSIFTNNHKPEAVSRGFLKDCSIRNASIANGGVGERLIASAIASLTAVSGGRGGQRRRRCRRAII